MQPFPFWRKKGLQQTRLISPRRSDGIGNKLNSEQTAPGAPEGFEGGKKKKKKRRSAFSERYNKAGTPKGKRVFKKPKGCPW